MDDLNMISLFSGIGGFELAAQWIGGINTIASVEINPFCQKVLTKHFPNTPIYNDVTSYSPEIGKAQIVCGGSPCQDLSIAGEQKGIIEGKRSSLWFEQLRIYKESRATFLVWENVAGAFRNGFREVLGSLSESGYDAEWQTISAAALGAPHLRERIFLIAYPTGLQFSKEPSPWADQIRCQAAIAATYPHCIGWDYGSYLERANQDRLHKEWNTKEDIEQWTEWQCGVNKVSVLAPDPDSPLSQRDGSAQRSFAERTKFIPSTRANYWTSTEPAVCGVDAGLPNRLDRLAALGNAIVPQCAAIPLLRVKYLAELIA